MSIKPMSQRFPAEDIDVNEETPERNLLAACIERSIRDVLNEREHEICRVAIAWFRSQSNENFSFKWICIQLSLCPILIRRYVYEMKKEGKPFPAFENRGHFYKGTSTKKRVLNKPPL